MNNKKVFEGTTAISDFLTPGALGPTPLIELPSSLNPFTKDKVRIFVKLTQFVPLSNIKSLSAWQMLSKMDSATRKKTKHLIEYSSGNTVLSLAILSKHFGIENMHAIITPDVPEHKKRLLRLVGAELLISHGNPSPGVFDTEGGIYDAKMMDQKEGWYNLHQYINQNNPKASEEYIGKELWKQLGNKLSIFAASIGTAGTILGAGSYLKKKNKNIFIAGASIKRGSSIPGPRGEDAIPKLGFKWESTVDKTYPIDTFSAFSNSLDLIRQGLFVGPSTGMQLAMVKIMLAEMKKKKQLDTHRNKNGEVVIAFIACDTMFTYIDEYFAVLPKKYFKEDKNLK